MLRSDWLGHLRLLLVAVGLGCSSGLAAEPTQDAPRPLAEAAGRMSLPEGFKVTLFAGEPNIHQPIAMTIDPRGRLWVVECYSYPLWLGGPEKKDRIVILEDTDGDGTSDRRKVFYEGGTNFTGITLGRGGVWVSATPNLLFFPDENGDDLPDSAPIIKLDGWDTKARHNMFNGLAWAPDGWLWGCNGILSNSRVGKPGTPDEKRLAINCGVWRYHPGLEIVEAVAHGTTNPWGLDFDEQGEAFITNCVIPHLFHVVPGARFHRMFGEDFNPFSYELIPTCADHVHWDTIEKWSDIRNLGVTQTTDAAGGGHAHVGALIYQGNNWPREMRGSVFTCNIHGHRINRDRLERSRSGYVARHEKDFLLAHDSWFRGLDLKAGPDGSVYLADWSDTGECHETDADNAHRENGRIYRITHGNVTPFKGDLAKLSSLELARLQTHENEWHVRTARRLLHDRADAKQDLSKVDAELRATLFNQDAPQGHRLRSFWALKSISLTEESLQGLLKDSDEAIRTWAVRTLTDLTPSLNSITALSALSQKESSPRVRLALASALQRIPVGNRGVVAQALLAHQEDVEDVPLSLMLWYGIEPIVPANPEWASSMIEQSVNPRIRRFLARRIVASDTRSGLGRLLGQLESLDLTAQRDVLQGILDALRGQKSIEAPGEWPRLFAALSKNSDSRIRELSALLGLNFKDAQAAAYLKDVVHASEVELPSRQRALIALTENQIPGMVPELLKLLDDPAMKSPAIQALGRFEDPTIAPRLLQLYPNLKVTEKSDAVATLAARPATCRVLLKALAEGQVPRQDLSPSIARQIMAFKDPTLLAQLETTWGTLRKTSADKEALIKKYKGLIQESSGPAPDSGRGRLVFNKTCLQCHKLFGEGGTVGPELTGSDRSNLDYFLENVLDPGATVGGDFQLSNVALKDGRLISGIIRSQDTSALTIQTANETLVVPRADVEEVATTRDSMMPEGLIDKLSSQELRDLYAYLASARQVPTPREEKP